MLKPFLSVCFLVLMVGCATGSPPTATERALYQVTTNYHTQVVQVVQADSEKVITNSFWVTNVVTAFELHPRPGVEAGIRAGGTVASGFGFGLGGIIGTIILGAYSAWATWRNGQKQKAIVALAQNVETGREVIKSMPGGEEKDEKFKAQIISQQVKAGVTSIVRDAVDNDVDNVAAIEAAEKVMDA